MKIEFDIADLRPLVEAVVKETLAAVKPTENSDDGRLVYSEAEVGAMLGLKTNVVREQRKLGRITPCNAKPGRRILYTRSAIDEFLSGNSREST